VRKQRWRFSLGPIVAAALAIVLGTTTALAVTKDRLPTADLIQLVSGPMAALREAGLAQAQEAFEGQLAKVRAAHGDDSVAASDQLHAMGIALFAEGQQTDRPDLMQAAIPYLRQAVAATRKAWGSGHPELALALNDYASAAHMACPQPAPTDLAAAMEEAYAIRLETLGPSNSETVEAKDAIVWMKRPCRPAIQSAPSPLPQMILQRRARAY
jgi:hypothetical protein